MNIQSDKPLGFVWVSLPGKGREGIYEKVGFVNIDIFDLFGSVCGGQFCADGSQGAGADAR
jgi:hypothetical protein